MNDEKCIWEDVFDKNERISLQGGFFFTGAISVFSMSLLSYVLLKTSLNHEQTYTNLANFTVFACIRRIVPIFAVIGPFKYAASWQDVSPTMCQVFGFLETFLGVAEVESLNHVCIERYVIARYLTRGWEIERRHYTLYRFLILLFACLYSIPPALGFGGFGQDFTCTSCTLDIILPNGWLRYYVITLFFLRSIKSSVMMIIMLAWALFLENKYYDSSKLHVKQIEFTKNAVAVTAASLLSWLPIGVIRGWVILHQLLYDGQIVMPKGTFVKLAMWLHWVAPLFVALALIFIDKRIRNIIFRLCYEQHENEKKEEKKE